MRTRDVLERIMDIWNKQKEVEEMINDLFCYIYHKELEEQRKEKEHGKDMR